MSSRLLGMSCLHAPFVGAATVPLESSPSSWQVHIIIIIIIVIVIIAINIGRT